MSVDNISQIISRPKYDFLRIDQNLGDNIVLLGYGGSHAYGLNN